MSDEQDIVQRLRTWPKVSGLCLDTDLMRQAADEIERLRPLTFCGCGDQFSAHDPGLGYVQIDGAPVLSDHACPACDSTGKRPMAARAAGHAREHGPGRPVAGGRDRAAGDFYPLRHGADAVAADRAVMFESGITLPISGTARYSVTGPLDWRG